MGTGDLKGFIKDLTDKPVDVIIIKLIHYMFLLLYDIHKIDYDVGRGIVNKTQYCLWTV